MTTVSAERLRRAAGRASYSTFGLVGQVLNAGTNVVTTYVASILLRPDSFGAFVIAFAAVTLVLAGGRGLIGSTMAVHLPLMEESTQRPMVRSALGFIIVIGLAATVPLLVFGPHALIWFAPWVTAALVQDVGRYALLARRQAGSALVLDVIWAVAQGLTIGGWLLLGGRLTLEVMACAWGIGATAGAIGYLVLAGIRPTWPGPWMRTTKDVAGWFTAVTVIGQAELYLVLLLTGALLGATDAGGLRAVQLLAYQPALVLLGALLTLVVPSMVTAGGSPDDLRRGWVRGLLSVAPVIVALLVVALLRDPLMRLLFVQYTAYAPLVIPVALQSICAALVVPPTALLRSLRRGPAVFRQQALRTVLLVCGAAVGMVLGGVTGLAWSLAATSAVSLVQISAVAMRALRDADGRIPLPRTAVADGAGPTGPADVAALWERAWAGVWVTTVVRPLTGVTSDHINGRHAELLARLPAGSWLASYDGPVASDCAEDLESTVLAMANQPWSGAPLRVLVQGDAVAVMHSHAIGDGQVSLQLVRDLLAPEGTPFVVPTWRRPSYVTVALAGLRWWLRKPGRIVQVANSLRSPRARAKGSAPRDRASLMVRTIEPHELRALRERRDASHPGVTTSVLLMSLVLDELAARDVSLTETVLAVNIRRYLHRKERLAGNLVAVLRLASLGRTVEDLAAELCRALDSGLPLAQFLLGNARYLLRRGRTTAVPRVSHPTLGWSDRGTVEGWDVVPWASGPRRIVPGVVPPWGRRIGVHLMRVDGRLHLACLVNTDAFDATMVSDALDAVIGALEPVGTRPDGIAL